MKKSKKLFKRELVKNFTYTIGGGSKFTKLYSCPVNCTKDSECQTKTIVGPTCNSCNTQNYCSTYINI